MRRGGEPMTAHDVIAVIFYTRAHMEKEAGVPSSAIIRTAIFPCFARALVLRGGFHA